MLKIVVTGPESSGKTTLAAALAAALGTLWVPEFARSYLAHLGRPYQRNDLKTIRLGQTAWEEWYAQHLTAAPLPYPLICDTDWTVLHVWEAYKFVVCSSKFEVRDAAHDRPGTSNSKLPPPHPTPKTPDRSPTSNFQLPTSNSFGTSNFELPTLYFLCSPDIPWHPDPLREHPDEREVLFEMYENLLLDIQAAYVVVRGTPEQRLQTALAAIREVL